MVQSVTARLGWLLLLASLPLQVLGVELEAPQGLPARPAWTASRVLGSPEPPPPYTVEPVFTKIDWGNLVYLCREPASKRLLAVEWPAADQGGRVLRVDDRPDADETTAFLTLPDRAIYSLAFHPDYEQNRQIFVCSKNVSEELNYLSRLLVPRPSPDELTPRCDPASEETILTWKSSGHDGAAVAFGHDGMLYVSVGDGTGDSDDDLTAQDPTNWQGSILRIDVDQPATGKPYSVPADNPFVDVAGVRGEIWSLGHRNPWRMTVDEKTGHLWVGNNGQDLWEYAHLIRKGDNAGWSVYEGSHPFYLNRQRGPGTFALPTVEHDHSAFRSLTGGVVYYGSELPDLQGAYIYGDYSTGAIWGVKHNGEEVVWNRKLAKTRLAIVDFATNHREELLVVDHVSGIYRLVPAPTDPSHPPFPQRLSETGLFADTARHLPHPGVVEYSVVAPGYNDGAVAERLLGVPGAEQISTTAATWQFPEGTVLAQTLSLKTAAADNAPRRRIETRILTKQRGQWAGYSYVWNDAQDDAHLAPPAGAEVPLPDDVVTADGTSFPHSVWKIPSRTDCLACHSRAANFVLGVNRRQLDRPVQIGDEQQNQLALFHEWNLFDADVSQADEQEETEAPPPLLVDPYDAAASVADRVRSYLDVNCAGCHTPAGGGNARINLGLGVAEDATHLLNAYPQHATFGLEQPRLVAPGEPDQSVLLERISRRGRGQMPPRGSQVVDARAVELVRTWIEQLATAETPLRSWTIDDLAEDLESIPGVGAAEAGEKIYARLKCGECHRLAGQGGGAGPNLDKAVAERSVAELLESIVLPSKQIAPEFAETIVQTSDGRTLRGRVQQEDAEKLVLHIAEAPETPVVLRQDEIEQRTLSPVSTMPKGLLNTLTKQEILDLLAYLKTMN